MKGQQHRIVVIGAGYVGALTASRAARRAGDRADVTLIDPSDTFVQRLRLHQVATGQHIAAPKLARLCGPRVTHVRGWAEAIDPAQMLVRLRADDGRASVPYDSLILATGSVADTDRVPGAAKHAHAVADLASARKLAGALDQAPNARVAVVGAGLTGIEAATEIAESRPDARVYILDREPLGAGFSLAGQEHLERVFDLLGIEVLDGVDVAAVEADAIAPATGPALPVDVTVWCGGFVPRPLGAEGGLRVGPGQGVLVDRRMRSVSHPDVMAVGDAAECPPLTNGAKVRMSCQAGIPAGAHAADVIAASLRGREEKDFDFGYIGWNISLGRRDGLIQWVDRADRPKDRVTRGRRGARVKELVTWGAVKNPTIDRRMPGALRWLSSGQPAPEVVPQELDESARTSAS